VTRVAHPGELPVASPRFADPADQEAFDRDGYLVGPDLDAGQLDGLRALWAEVGPGEVDGIWSNVHVLDPATNRRVDQAITEAFRPLVERVLVDGRLAGASFLVKGTGPASASEPHQDWNNVDEHRALSLSMWCPLVDVDEANGALQVLPGSHRLRPTVRSIDTPSLTVGFADADAADAVRAVPLPAGRCVFYAHNLFHGSRPNRGDRSRVAVTSGVLPDGVQHVHYRRRGDGFEELAVERDFYFSGMADMAAGRLPDSARVARTVSVPGGSLTLAEVLGPVGAPAVAPSALPPEPPAPAPSVAERTRRVGRRLRRALR
jgi:Phytanoyl-CoA dioxygenase (PhyH)